MVLSLARLDCADGSHCLWAAAGGIYEGLERDIYVVTDALFLTRNCSPTICNHQTIGDTMNRRRSFNGGRLLVKPLPCFALILFWFKRVQPRYRGRSAFYARSGDRAGLRAPEMTAVRWPSPRRRSPGLSG